MKSMTGFGRSEKEASFGKLVIEIQSVNRKYFELNLSLPKEFSRFEHEIRKQVSEQVQRGSVWVRVYVFPSATSMNNLLPDVKLLKSLRSGWEQVAEALGYNKQAIDFPFLIKNFADMPQARLANDEDFAPISEALSHALQALEEMKSVEGKALAKDMSYRLTLMETQLGSIEEIAPEAVAKMRQKLKERLEEIYSQSEQLDERLLREVALFAEKIDISEEITRFRSHLAQYREYLALREGPVGRKMDFLTQEMGREINTIGSKSMDARISHLVVNVKSELEKIREQNQNIE